jgi:hypothetical protein
VTFNGQDGYAIGRNLGVEPPRAANAPRGQRQADMQRLRRGYEDYFDGQADGQCDGPDVAYAEPRGYVAVPGPYYYAPPPGYYYPRPYYYGYGYGRPYGYWRRW